MYLVLTGQSPLLRVFMVFFIFLQEVDLLGTKQENICRNVIQFNIV